MNKLIIVICFGLCMGSSVMGMDKKIYDKDAWLPVDKQVKVKIEEDIIKIYQFEPPEYKENKISGRFFIDGEAAGTYEIISKVKHENDYLYFVISFPEQDNKPIFEPWYLKQKNGNLLIAIGECHFPKHAERLELFKKREQSLKEKEKKADLWDSHKAIISQSIQSDWGLWLTKTTKGKCISGIAGLLALYGTGRIMWDTQTQWKKGGTYLLALLKKMLIKKRKRRKKHLQPAQKVS